MEKVIASELEEVIEKSERTLEMLREAVRYEEYWRGYEEQDMLSEMATLLDQANSFYELEGLLEEWEDRAFEEASRQRREEQMHYYKTVMGR